MKRLTLTIALLAAFAANAQDSTSSGQASANSTASPTVNTSSGNSSSNVNASGAATANPNNSAQQMIQLNTYGPDHQSVDSNSTSSSTSTSNNTNTVNGTQRVINEGGVTNRNINEGESVQRVIYSGSQTVKSAPAIQMSGPASGPCTGASGGVGISGPGWGVGLNGSAVMDDCRMRENTRVLGMAMQSLDGQANPQEKGEVTVIFMDAVRNLGAYNNTIYNRAAKEAK
jgi:hypothetical protein